MKGIKMKKIVAGLVLLSLGSSMALAGDYYGGVDFDFGKGSTEAKSSGITLDKDFTQTAFGVHGGYYLNSNSKVEISFKSLNWDNDKDNDTDGTQLGVDYLYELNEVSKVKPYVGVGLSMNSLDIKLSNKDTIDGVGFKLRGGVYYSLTPKLYLGAELNYNYIGWEDLKNTRNDSTLESSSSFYGLGLNVNFKF